MAKARAIVKRRKAIRNIKKITRTMELIATARFKKAMDRAQAATAYTRKLAELVADLGQTDLDVSHPLLEVRDPIRTTALLVLSSNRGLAGGYNANVIRVATKAHIDAQVDGRAIRTEVSGKRGISYCRFRNIHVDRTYTQFEDKPQFSEVEPIAERFIQMYRDGEIDQLLVVYTRFVSSSRQEAEVATLLPLTDLAGPAESTTTTNSNANGSLRPQFEFRPNPESILEELVPAALKARLFKCFLDAAVSEQIARMIAMRGATQNAEDMVKSLTRSYNKARQTQITRELSEVISASDALSG